MSIPTPKRLHPSLGAEIEGLDLREPLSAEDREAVSAALAEHIVLVCQKPLKSMAIGTPVS